MNNKLMAFKIKNLKDIMKILSQIKFQIKFIISMKKVKPSCSLKYQKQKKVLLLKAKSKVVRTFSINYLGGNFK